jgi:hypothetical protein
MINHNEPTVPEDVSIEEVELELEKSKSLINEILNNPIIKAKLVEQNLV